MREKDEKSHWSERQTDRRTDSDEIDKDCQNQRYAVCMSNVNETEKARKHGKKKQKNKTGQSVRKEQINQESITYESKWRPKVSQFRNTHLTTFYTSALFSAYFSSLFICILPQIFVANASKLPSHVGF